MNQQGISEPHVVRANTSYAISFAIFSFFVGFIVVGPTFSFIGALIVGVVNLFHRQLPTHSLPQLGTWAFGFLTILLVLVLEVAFVLVLGYAVQSVM